MARGIRVLFQSYGRRGLGHLVRGSNIAHAIMDLAPNADVMFYTRCLPPRAMRDDRFGYTLETDPQAMSRWDDLANSWRPDVIVYDTMLPKRSHPETLACPARRVYVMRRSKPARHRAIVNHPFLAHVDQILVPHDRDEFGHDLPHPLTERTVFVGPIVRVPSTTAATAMRHKYHVSHAAFLITSTPGGGGFGPDTDAFFDVVYHAHRQLTARIPKLHHVVIQGPRNRSALPALDQMTVVPIEPDLVALIAASDVVIAAGGYNTVNEVRLCKTPAVFLPGSRTHDDQAHRVSRFADLGLGWVFDEQPPTDVARQIADRCASPEALNQVARQYDQDQFETGNRHAAQQILSLVQA